MRHFYSITIWVLFYFTFVDEFSENVIIQFSTESSLSVGIFIFPFLGLQAIFATIQSTLSDFYCRKKSLIAAFFIILLSLLALKLSYKFGIMFLFLSFALKAIGGNIIPMARAALADTKGKHNFRLALAFSICAIALGSFGQNYISLFIDNLSLLYLTFVIVFLSIIFSILIFKDAKDKDIKSKNKPPKNEMFSLFSDYIWDKKFLLALVGYFLAEVAFYQILFREDIFTRYKVLKYVPLELGIGYYLGTIYLGFSKANDQKNIFLGITAAVGSSFLYLLFQTLSLDNQLVKFSIFTIYGCGFGIFIPSLFSLVSVSKPLHDQGKIYGLIDSTDMIATTISFIIVLSLPKISVLTVMAISSFIILMCIFPFYKICKSKTNAKN